MGSSWGKSHSMTVMDLIQSNLRTRALVERSRPNPGVACPRNSCGMSIAVVSTRQTYCNLVGFRRRRGLLRKCDAPYHLLEILGTVANKVVGRTPASARSIYVPIEMGYLRGNRLMQHGRGSASFATMRLSVRSFDPVP